MSPSCDGEWSGMLEQLIKIHACDEQGYWTLEAAKNGVGYPES